MNKSLTVRFVDFAGSRSLRSCGSGWRHAFWGRVFRFSMRLVLWKILIQERMGK
jgi:hypothetical protein